MKRLGRILDGTGLRECPDTWLLRCSHHCSNASICGTFGYRKYRQPLRAWFLRLRGSAHHFLQNAGDASPDCMDINMAILRPRYNMRLFCTEVLQISAHSCAASVNMTASLLLLSLIFAVGLSGNDARAPDCCLSDIKIVFHKECRRDCLSRHEAWAGATYNM